ncbi:helix-turn-helix domain-containing protein [Belnapia moabensis]|uniref:helix-turn-helix domain-containing protein n=1 Tax=Belnapia moabensis TaxID=365533 RepID=UPI000693B79D
MPHSKLQHAEPHGPAVVSEYLTQSEIAKRYKLSERTIERWRLIGEGPPFVRVGPRRILYRLTDCEAWLAERTHPDRAAELARKRRPIFA